MMGTFWTRYRLLFLSLVLAVPVTNLPAQELNFSLFNPQPDPKLRYDWALWPPQNTPPSRLPRVRLFRMPTGYLNEPVGLDTDPDPAPQPLTNDSPGQLLGFGEDDPVLNRLQVSMGTDNPHFDFRMPGDPGGVGFYRLETQILLLESSSSGLTLGCQAVTPAGLEADGIADGPTIVRPSMAWFQELGDGTGLHGFVSTQLRANSRWLDNLDRGIQYGMAIHRPLPFTSADSGKGMFMFVEALGRYRIASDSSAAPGSKLEILPGVHWQMNDNWWLSGGVIMPVGTPRLDANLWQITCSWRF
jgi:hypothetical protein